MDDLPDLWSAPPPPPHDATSADVKASALARQPHEVTLPLGALKVRVWDGHGGKLKLNHKAFACGGGATLTVRFAKQDAATLRCGWFGVAASAAPGGDSSSDAGRDLELPAGVKPGSPDAKRLAAQAAAKGAAAAEAKQRLLVKGKPLKAQSFERRWVALSQGRLAVFESASGGEPDLELSLRAILSCRMVKASLRRRLRGRLTRALSLSMALSGPLHAHSDCVSPLSF
jgi:hypothetical protein